MHRFRARTQSRGAIALCLTALVCGCGDDGSAVPAGCSEGERAILTALRSAPAPVRLSGGRLSDCLSEEADGGELQLVGTSFVDAASHLSPSARRRPESRSALELGYLVGAAHRAGDRTQGVHDELLRRLDQEAAPLEGSRAYERGRRAGQRGG